MASLLKKSGTWGSSLAVFALAFAIAWVLPRAFPFVRQFESYIADIQVSRLSPPVEPNPDIVILGFTEATLEQFPYRSPIDREQLAVWLEAIEAKGARAVAFDLFFDQSTEPAKDTLFAERLASASIPVVSVWGGSELDAFLTENQKEFQKSYLPENVIRALPTLIKDDAGTVRWIPPPVLSPAPGEAGLGFAPAIASALGLPFPKEKMEIAYRGYAAQAMEVFPLYPAHSAPVLPEAWIKDKIVLFGANLPSDDRHRTPFSVIGGDNPTMPGTWIHAQALAQILDGRQPPRASAWLKAAVAIGLVLIGMWLAGLDWPSWLKIVLVSGCVILFWIAAFVLYQRAGLLFDVIMPTVALTAAFGLTSAYSSSRHRQETRAIREAFGHYVAPAVVKQLEAEPERLQLGGELRELTYVFSDIAGFTSLSEEIGASKLVSLLNEYLEGMTNIILGHEGTIDKFIGDATVCLFNAPEEQPDHARRAVLCALGMDTFAQSFSERQQAAGVRFGITRIGAHTGKAVIGNFGGKNRFDYTAIGDSVNTAARLEGVNKYFGTRICISSATVDQCDGLTFRPVGDLVLKGKTEAIGVFEPVNPALVDRNALEAYNAAYELMRKEDSGSAAAFERLLTEYPDDPLFHFHLERLRSNERGTRIVMKAK